MSAVFRTLLGTVCLWVVLGLPINLSAQLHENKVILKSEMCRLEFQQVDSPGLGIPLKPLFVPVKAHNPVMIEASSNGKRLFITLNQPDNKPLTISLWNPSKHILVTKHRRCKNRIALVTGKKLSMPLDVCVYHEDGILLTKQKIHVSP